MYISKSIYLLVIYFSLHVGNSCQRSASLDPKPLNPEPQTFPLKIAPVAGVGGGLYHNSGADCWPKTLPTANHPPFHTSKRCTGLCPDSRLGHHHLCTYTLPSKSCNQDAIKMHRGLNRLTVCKAETWGSGLCAHARSGWSFSHAGEACVETHTRVLLV